MTPYGYKIEGGHATLDPEAAPKVMAFYRHYLDGLPVEPACIAAGVEREPHSAWRILEDKRYLGDDFYPRIIDPEVFQRVQEERAKRNHHPVGQITHEIVPGVVATQFRMKRVSHLPQNTKLIPQLLYDNIQPYAGKGTQEPLDPDERERILFHLSYAMDMLPDAALTLDETPQP